MGVFNTKAILKGDPALISKIANRICKEFHEDGYEGYRDNLSSGGVDISLTKGSFFKSVLGMDTALKIKLEPQQESISFDAGIGIFRKEAIPMVISMFFMWPVILTQIWGLVKQSKIDDKALDIAKSVIKENRSTPYMYVVQSSHTTQVTAKTCARCGTKLPGNARFCSNCGHTLI